MSPQYGSAEFSNLYKTGQSPEALTNRVGSIRKHVRRHRGQWRWVGPFGLLEAAQSVERVEHAMAGLIA